MFSFPNDRQWKTAHSCLFFFKACGYSVELYWKSFALKKKKKKVWEQDLVSTNPKTFLSWQDIQRLHVVGTKTWGPWHNSLLTAYRLSQDIHLSILPPNINHFSSEGSSQPQVKGRCYQTLDVRSAKNYYINNLIKKCRLLCIVINITILTAKPVAESCTRTYILNVVQTFSTDRTVQHTSGKLPPEHTN